MVRLITCFSEQSAANHIRLLIVCLYTAQCHHSTQQHQGELYTTHSQKFHLLFRLIGQGYYVKLKLNASSVWLEVI